MSTLNSKNSRTSNILHFPTCKKSLTFSDAIKFTKTNDNGFTVVRSNCIPAEYIEAFNIVSPSFSDKETHIRALTSEHFAKWARLNYPLFARQFKLIN